MNITDLGLRSTRWRESQGLSADPAWIMSKATEELGEVARALVGIQENRPGRGDIAQEIAQTIIVLSTLLYVVRPEVDLRLAIGAEMQRLGA